MKRFRGRRASARFNISCHFSMLQVGMLLAQVCWVVDIVCGWRFITDNET